MLADLIQAVSKLEEPDIIDFLVVPLIERLHPGKIEFTHSALEAGRDIISIGTDTLGRKDILCVQVKADCISFGGQFPIQVVSPATLAKTEGVTSESGTKHIPNEVWFITSTHFSDPERRQVADTIQNLERKNIKFIARDELCNLCIRNIKDHVKKIIKLKNENTFLIEKFSKYPEYAIFKPNEEKNIDELYINATLSPYTSMSYGIISGDIKIHENFTHTYQRRLKELITDIDVDEKLVEKIIENENKKIKLEKFFTTNIDFLISISLIQYIDELDGSTNITKSKLHEIANNENSKNILIHFKIIFYTKDHFEKIHNKIAQLITDCPKILNSRPAKISETLHYINNLEKFTVEFCSKYQKFSIHFPDNWNNSNIELRISVIKPENITKISNNILIEGPPGCGKTTLLRKVFVSLLKKNASISYIQCSSIQNSSEILSINDLIEKFSHKNKFNNTKLKDCILLIDGLDESSVDIKNLIFSYKEKFKNILISTRSSYAYNIRKDFINIKIAPFTDTERNEFFSKFFKYNKQDIDNARDLIFKYPDIDEHTRLPLIATITASLLQNGYLPTTRYEIYNFRLDLLLSKWDRGRGVRRISIDNPNAKKRFLYHLAWRVHSEDKRRRTFNNEDMLDIYNSSLGKIGYDWNYDQFVDELIRAHGLIIHERNDIFSFGHLSFQEHLAGEYLSENYPTASMMHYLGNDWWQEPLIFWASRQGDITPLFDHLIDESKHLAHIKQLKNLIKFAPYTAPAIFDILDSFKKDFD